MFNEITSKVNFPDLERSVLEFWSSENTFDSLENATDKPLFVFYEGPPTANGSPGIHHILARVFKDIICRYKTMKGFKVIRKGGWDTHGLPVELEIEKQLGLKSKKDIESFGIQEFNQKCRDSVFHYVKEWESLTERIGFWINMKDPYVTLDRSYIETCWWIIKQLWERNLIYKGMKGTPHCPRCVSSLSSHEVALGYQENTPDPSVFIKFPLDLENPGSNLILKHISNDENPTSRVYFLAWTTTPWTLPANTALAVDPKSKYVVIEIKNGDAEEFLILAEELASTVIKEPFEIKATLKGSDLAGLNYTKLYDPKEFGTDILQFHVNSGNESTTMALDIVESFQPIVVSDSFVSLSEGTGIVHIAPAFGDEDLRIGHQHGLAFVQPVDLQGNITGNYQFSGKFVKDADKEILEDLSSKGLIYLQEIYHHTYPFCWRCATPLLYYAKESWYINTTTAKDRLIKGNQGINWHPDHIKEGRFGEWLRNGVDWAISRERYWGTPIPIWECQNCPTVHCIGDLSELKAMSIDQQKDQIESLDLHRPHVDEIILRCPKCGANMNRVPEVLDAWFDSGAMPLAQWNITSTTELTDLIANGLYPADYICEAVDQTRGWFYSLLVLSILITDQPSYKNVICLGLIQDEKGRKMSKTLGNIVDPWSILDTQGADATRWYLFTATQPGDSRRFSDRLVNEVIKRFMLTLWNVYSFFTTYANIDKYNPTQSNPDTKYMSDLDRWIISELNSLMKYVGEDLEDYSPTSGGRRIEDFVDLLSNWYVRRSRRRFWKSENDRDKHSAYSTLHACLSNLAKILAPFTPFLAETMYQNLIRSHNKNAPTSVHQDSFPSPKDSLIDQDLMKATRLAMKISSLGRDARSRARTKVRQPLRKLLVKTRDSTEHNYVAKMKDQILDELNIKEIEILLEDNPLHIKAKQLLDESKDVLVDNYQVVTSNGYLIAIDTTITTDLAEEGLARELVHRVQMLRRSSGLEVSDRIILFYQGPKEVGNTLTRFNEYISEETLSDTIVKDNLSRADFTDGYQIQGMDIRLGISRTSQN